MFISEPTQLPINWGDWVSEIESNALHALRQRGFAVVVLTPSELDGEHRGMVEEHLLEEAWEYLEFLKEHA